MPVKSSEQSEAQVLERIAALASIKEAILQFQSLLDLKPDWDEDGARPIAEDTWKRATGFLARQAEWMWEVYGKAMALPDITPVPDGSIDLHWDRPDYELLVNIPTDADAPAGFYGDDRNRLRIEGRLYIQACAPAAGAAHTEPGAEA